MLVLSAALVAIAMSACATSNSACCANSACPQKCKNCGKCNSMKLTKDMFYKNGKFDDKAAIEAYIAMMEKLGYPVSDNLRQNMWASDFGLGDFPAVGMGGIFWIHDNTSGIFGHEIILLPNQMLIEHAHFPHNGLPAKYESWQCRAGKSYCFGEEGEDASKYPDVKVPESQKNFITVHKVAVADAKKGNIVRLNRKQAFHYQIAGPEGAVVTEYGVYHQNEGNRYTNPNVKF